MSHIPDVALPGLYEEPEVISQQHGFAPSPIRAANSHGSAEDDTYTENATRNPHRELAAPARRLLSISSLKILQEPQKTPLDLRSLEYVGSYDHNLMCPICRCPFVQPVKLDCEHFFCRECVSLALTHLEGGSKCCPSCRRKISQSSIVSAPKIINRILDELLVKCPFNQEGCSKEMPRGSVQDHVDRYCSFSEIKCLSEECPFTVRRKDARRKRCLHNFVCCEYCDLSFMEKDLEFHKTTECNLRMSSCPHCESKVLHRDLDTHVESCPEATLPCPAAPYGCDFTCKRASLDQHITICPLAKLTPFLKLQKERLAAHETALNHIRLKNSLLESSFASFQETLNPPSSDLDDLSASSESNGRSSPFDSTAHHLLCLHESLREEVARVSAALSELDANAKLMVMNESLRTKEELAHTNAVVGGMRMQLHWLMNARLQKQQKGAMMRGREFAGPGPSTGVEPVKGSSDPSPRQETKL